MSKTTAREVIAASIALQTVDPLHKVVDEITAALDAAGFIIVPKEPTLFARECLEGRVGTDWIVGWNKFAAASQKP